MTIANRDLDSSQQLERLFDYSSNQGQVINTAGLTLIIGTVPYYCNLAAIRISGYSVTLAPTINFAINRFCAGAGGGATSIVGFATALALQEVGTSGIQSVVLSTVGSSLLQLAPGDLLMANMAGASSTVLRFGISVIVKTVADIKNAYNAF